MISEESTNSMLRRLVMTQRKFIEETEQENRKLRRILGAALASRRRYLRLSQDKEEVIRRMEDGTW